MQTFIDSKGRGWKLTIDQDAAQRAFMTTRVPLRQMCHSKTPAIPLGMNWELFTTLLFCLVERFADIDQDQPPDRPTELIVDQDGFAASLATEAATEAALDALVAEIMGEKDAGYKVRMRHVWQCSIHQGRPEVQTT